MWGVPATPAQAQWAARQGPWCRKWLAFIVALTERLVLVAALTAAARTVPRADYVLWTSMWRRVAALWMFFGAEIVLIGVVTWTKARADAVTLQLEQTAPREERNLSFTGPPAPKQQVEDMELAPVDALPPIWGRRGSNTVVPLPVQVATCSDM